MAEKTSKAKWFLKLREKIAGNRKVSYVIVILLIALVLILFVSSFFKTNQNSNTTNNYSTSISDNSFESFMEDRLSRVLNSVKGISSVKVFVSVESSNIVNYAKDVVTDSNNSKNGETIVFSKNGTKTEPVIISLTYPEIKGVLVVAKGITPKTNLELTNCLSLVLNIPLSSIQIMEGK